MKKSLKMHRKQPHSSWRRDQAKAGRQNKNARKTGLFAVAAGDGMNEIFKGLGVDVVIEGGQDDESEARKDMLNAIDQVNADPYFYTPEQQEYYSGCKSGAVDD